MELHTAKDKKVIIDLLRKGKVDINALNEESGEAPVHTLVRKAANKKNSANFDNLWNFLVYCDSNKFDINAKTKQGNTALHIAAENDDLDTVRALVVFDADMNSLNFANISPMDHVILNKNQEMAEFMQTHGALHGTTLRKRKKDGEDVTDSMPVHLRGGGLPTLKTTSLDVNPNIPAVSSGETPLELSVHDGQRILCLDGGGLKGLILIEVLIYIEKLTGKRIVDLFDWIVGNSTGGIIALALVYGRKSLQNLKQLFFQLKDEVFGQAKFRGFGCDTRRLSEILRSYFGEEMKMTKYTEPRVMITAVDCKKTDLKLVFFNNCLFDGDEKYRDVLVWKVARYTSAAPVYFEPEDNYIDGGIKANNPTDYALTKIQNYYDVNDKAMKRLGKESTTKYACVVSVGCGIFHPDDLGDFSIQKYFSLSFQSLATFPKFFSEIINLLNLLGNATSHEEEIAESCRLRCEKQGIPFYRFSPAFDASTDIKVPVGETDVPKLCGLIIRAQDCLNTQWNVQVHRLAKLLRRVEKSRIQAHGFKY